MDNVETVTMQLEEINPAKYNPRKDLQPGDPQYESLKKSMQEFDCVENLVVNKANNNTLISGHQRLKVLKDLGYTEVKVNLVSIKEEEREKALNIALNKIQGDWDTPKLKDIMEELKETDIDLNLTGFSQDERRELLSIDKDINPYTDKTDTPVYEPKQDKPPDINELYNDHKARELTEEINQANIPDDEKTFLTQAAQRHIVFNYSKIAEYYAHASPETRRLMEKSALVIIDYQDAIKEGYVELTKEMKRLMGLDKGEGQE